MRYKDFETILYRMHKHHQKLDQAYKLGIDLLDAFSEMEEVNTALWSHVLTEEGKDWLYWFLYEKGYIDDAVGRRDLQAWDENKNLICEDVKGLYDYLMTQKYFRV